MTSYVRAPLIPRDSRFVVRTAALQEFEARILDTDKPTEKPLERRERTTLLVIIAALAKYGKDRCDQAIQSRWEHREPN